MGRAREFDIDTFELPFGVHLPPYSESDPCKELNPPLYENLYPQPKLEDRRSIDIRQIGLCHNVQTVNQHSERYNYSQRYSGDMPDRYSITVDVVWIWHRSFLPVGVHMLLVSPKTSFYHYKTETIAAHAHQEAAVSSSWNIGLVFAPGGKRCVSSRRKWKFSKVQKFTHDSIVQEAEWCSVLMENWFISPSRNLLPCCSQTEFYTSGMYFIYMYVLYNISMCQRE